MTLSVLYVHFSAMLPYCYDRIADQQRAIEELGEAAWLEQNLHPTDERAAAAKPRDAGRVVPLRIPRRHALENGPA